MPHLVPCTQDHIEHLKPTIRKSDRIELWLASGRDPEEALQMSFDLSDETYAVLKDGEVLCVFGVCTHRNVATVHVPWLICAERFAEVAGWRFAFRCRKVIKDMLTRYPKLYNSVWREHTEAIKWLEWCGFRFLEPYQNFIGAWFVPFIMEAPHV